MADFGLALKEEDLGQDLGLRRYARVHEPRTGPRRRTLVGRTLGRVQPGGGVLQVLTGTRPFRGDTVEEVDRSHPASGDPAAASGLRSGFRRSWSGSACGPWPNAPRNATRRPGDMADDLRQFLAEHGEQVRGGDLRGLGGGVRPRHGRRPTTIWRRLCRTGRPIPPDAERVVPKGLRSFDRQDADFFLALLPGPRDRDGLPESIRFWKTRAESARPRRHVSRRRDLRAVRLRQVVAGQGRLAAAAGRRPRGLGLHRSHGRRHRDAAAAAAAKRLSPAAPARQLARDDRGLAPQAGAQRRQEGADRAGPVRAVAARPVGSGSAAN